MDTPKSGIAPAPEIIHFIRYQQTERFSQLFLKKKSVKTHFSEYSFDIIQHDKQ
jgi:hypothetical protein